MGRVMVTALIENLNDLAGVHAGTLPSEQVRKVEVTDEESGVPTVSFAPRKSEVGLLDQVELPLPIIVTCGASTL